METIVICALFGIFILISFITGLSYGVKLRNNDKIETINPIKTLNNAIKNKKAQTKEEEKNQELETMLENIDNYDGTEIGQKEI